MQRLAIILSAVLMFAGGLAVASQLAQAQDEEMSTQGHVLVGAWLADTDDTDANAFDAVFLFHDDGTYVEFDAAGEDSPGETDGGIWSATGEYTADLTIVSVFTDEDGVNAQFIIRASIEVAEDGQSFTAQYTIEVQGYPGAEGQYGPGTATGTRIAIESMGGPIGGLDELFGQFEGGATPVADESGALEGISFEPIASGHADTLPPAPATVNLIRIGIESGAKIEVPADDPGTALILVESGTLTLTVTTPVTVTRGATGATEAIPANTEVTLEAGDSFLGPSGSGGELRNDGEEQLVLLLATVEPDQMDGTPTA